MASSLFYRVANKLPSHVIRYLFNLWPPFRGAGIKVKHISRDFRKFDVSMKLKLLNRNSAGVHFGGSLFGMTDPFYVVMLTKNLGDQYIVWDKAGKIDFKKPGRGTIKASCFLTEEEIDLIRDETNRLGKYIFDRSVDLFNEKNEVIATIVKTIYVRRREKMANN